MDHRLPRTILPTAYAVRIEPDLEQGRFAGRVRIDASVIHATDQLVCNAADLTIESVTVDGVARPFEARGESERLVVDLGAREPGPVRLEASFSGVLSDQLRGFYRSTFTSPDGVEQVIATTQFQSTDARRAFPCFDEPDMKATFDITLVVDPELVAVSNSPEVARHPTGEGRVEVRFDTTMPMSTYLVAFVVGPLEITGPVMAGPTPVRIVHRPGQGPLTRFALDVAVAALAYFEDYYDIPYPAGKLDMIALPDFAMGAMENLGCVTYREVLLLVDPETATQPELQNVADVVNHELAHMWFGDLVTMRWWNGIWLNEAFATFMEMKATDSFRPEWDRWTSFGLSRAQAFDVDSLSTTRPVEFPVHSPDEAEAMFDLLTYEKGAAVVRMLEQWLGEDVFREGIRTYLRDHQFGNTETHDLWNALEAVSGRPVTEAMATWIFQGGYPVVEIQGETIHQRRFGYGDRDSDARWTVPVGIRDVDGSVTTLQLDAVAQPLPTPAERIASVNHRGHGFYRVKLAPERLRAIGADGTGDLDAVERFSLVDDTWSMTLAAEVDVGDYIALLDGFRDETDVSVWQRIIGTMAFVRHVAPDDLLVPLGERVLALTDRIHRRLGDAPLDGESGRTRQLRGAILAARGTLTPDAESLHRAEQVHSMARPDSELLSAAVKVLAARGRRDRFDEFRARYESADNPQEEMRYLYALPTFDGAAEIGELVGMAIDGTIRTQNAPFVLAQAMMNRSQGPAVWARVAADWDALEARFPSSTIVRMLTGVRWLVDEATRASVASFFEDRPVPQGQQQLDQHLERLEVNAAFRARARRRLGEVLGNPA